MTIDRIEKLYIKFIALLYPIGLFVLHFDSLDDIFSALFFSFRISVRKKNANISFIDREFNQTLNRKQFTAFVFAYILLIETIESQTEILFKTDFVSVRKG